MNEIGKRVRARRDVLRLTQAELAAKAGITQGAVGNFESGARQNPRALLALARALAVSPQWLETGRGSPEDVSPAPSPVPLMAEYQPVTYAVEVLAQALDAMEAPGRYQVEELLKTLARAPDSAKARAALVHALDRDRAGAPPAPPSGNATGTDG